MTGFGEERKLLYHASDHMVKVNDIIFPGPDDRCDFGRGFYLTDIKEVAEEWVCGESNPVINVFSYAIPANGILKLEGTDWLRVIVGFRRRKYKVHFKSPVIHGMIADDRMAETLPYFLGENQIITIGDKRLLLCLDYCKLGNQYCFRNDATGLTYEHSYVLKGMEMQRALSRFHDRRRGMSSEIQRICRIPFDGERYIDDYLKDGDYYEV